jgi:hypothetical protein
MFVVMYVAMFATTTIDMFIALYLLLPCLVPCSYLYPLFHFLQWNIVAMFTIHFNWNNGWIM